MAAGHNHFHHPEGGDGANLFITVLFVSLFLHMLTLAGLYVYGEFIKPSLAPRIKQDVYVVHLIDPGPLTGKFEMGRSSVVDAAPMPTATRMKEAAPPAKLEIPVTKDTGGEVKKVAETLKKSPETKVAPMPEKKVPPAKQVEAESKKTSKLKQKTPVTEAKETEAAAREVRERKGGGSVDIRKFPYEWYLNIMESRIYGNWDTFRSSFFTNRQVRVTVFFELGRDGQISGLAIEHSSLNDEVDQSALAAVRNSGPFPPLPPGYKEKSLEVHFGFVLQPSH
ncbi:MAG: TonB family protein [Candidatus Nitrosotenuis sp.]|nr:MAG: TonB family protein [Candidatus Nitrosotenuis sp.]